MAIRIVTIAHTTGAAGDSIGRGLAERLHFRYVDEQIIEAVAQKEGLDTILVADAERKTSFFTRLMEELGRTPALEVSGAGDVSFEAFDLPRRSELRALIVEAIHETAGSGDVVIVSHAAGIPLAGRDDVLRVLVTASFDTRARRLASATNVAQGEAERRLKESDAGRADYFRRFYGIERELPTHYDLVVNTDRLTEDEATAIVFAAARPSPGAP
jgi:NAD(P)-dependent dehydrogenase (short-subunit alcohol dehydrogenase family)